MRALVYVIGIPVGIVVIMSIILIATSLQRLDTKDIAIRYDNFAKVLGTETEYEGLHSGPPGFYFIIFPSIYETMEFDDITCLTSDGVIITLDVSYQFRANGKNLLELVKTFESFDGYKKVLNASGKQAIHDTCAVFTTAQFQTDRGRFQGKLRDNMEITCNDLYCDLNDLQVNNVKRPSLYETAVRDKEAAKEDIKIALNERPRQILQAETELEKAYKEAEILLNAAETNVLIVNNRAENEAKALAFRYEKDLEIYTKIKSSQNLSNEGLISYIRIRAIGGSKNDINLAMQSPSVTDPKKSEL